MSKQGTLLRWLQVHLTHKETGRLVAIKKFKEADGTQLLMFISDCLQTRKMSAALRFESSKCFANCDKKTSLACSRHFEDGARFTVLKSPYSVLYSCTWCLSTSKRTCCSSCRNFLRAFLERCANRPHAIVNNDRPLQPDRFEILFLHTIFFVIVLVCFPQSIKQISFYFF